MSFPLTLQALCASFLRTGSVMANTGLLQGFPVGVCFTLNILATLQVSDIKTWANHGEVTMLWRGGTLQPLRVLQAGFRLPEGPHGLKDNSDKTVRY